MADRSKQSRAQAEASFRMGQKAERDKDKSAALQEYEASAQATRDKSARLKEQRLAKEASDRQEKAEAASLVKKRGRRPK